MGFAAHSRFFGPFNLAKDIHIKEQWKTFLSGDALLPLL
jgi:hypothetical protein